MKAFELAYRLYLPYEHPLYRYLSRLIRRQRGARMLDVGGRRSNYTIGARMEVLITDVARENEEQHRLDLGATNAIRNNVLRRRSNVRDYIYDDMTMTALQDGTFDVVVAAEVLEHVERDDAFVANVARLLTSGGTFIMTTPNGDFIPVPYPQHVRHYTGKGLSTVLARHFSDVRILYRVNSGKLFRLGLHRPTLRRPFRTCVAMVAFAAASLGESLGFGGKGPSGKLHLVAICTK